MRDPHDADAVLLGARRLRELLESRAVRPTRTLGQNFVIDPNTIRKVVDVARLSPQDEVLEIGAGAGSLTLGLAAVARRVIAVEVDQRLVDVLEEVVGDRDDVEVVNADALTLDLAATATRHLVANLPYNIAIPVVMKVLEDAPQIEHLTVMTQREVGERLAASAGSKTYGQVSVLVAYFAEARVAARISRRAFYPVPNVDSVLVRIDRRLPPSGVERDVLYGVVKTAFAQRRKTLRASLASYGSIEDACRRAGIDPGIRPEQVDLEGFVALVRNLSVS